MKEKLLIVEDETRIAQWIKLYTEREGYHCVMCENGREALDCFHQEQPDLILLDLMLPEIDGWQVCESIRSYSDVPIIMLTARIGEQDIIQGLKIGADDYVTKPFSMPQLLARIEANLRRSKGKFHGEERLEGGPISLDFATRQCLIEGRHVNLTANQFELLAFFMRHPMQVFSREQLIENVFGMDYDSYERAIDIHIRRLRMKIEADPSDPHYIQTVFGAGYRFSPEGG